MSLPTPPVPTYELSLPSSGKKIKFRPFLVKEEKILLLAMDEDENGNIDSDKALAAVKDILRGCILTKIDVDSLATFDLEYLFLRIRAVSAGEEVKMKVTCLDDQQTVVNVNINLLDIEVEKDPKHTNKIMLSDTMGMVMKYPGIGQFVNLTLINNDLKTADEVFENLAECVDQIFEGEEVWDSESMSKKDIIEFVEKMTQQQFEQVQNFFDTMPILRYKFKVRNPNTGVESEYTLEGLQSFLG